MLLDNLEETGVVETSVLGKDVDLGNQAVQLNLERAPGLLFGTAPLELLCLIVVVRELALHLANLDVLEAVHLLQLALKQFHKIALIRLGPVLCVSPGLEHVLELVVRDVVERPFGLNGLAQVRAKLHDVLCKRCVQGWGERKKPEKGIYCEKEQRKRKVSIQGEKGRGRRSSI